MPSNREWLNELAANDPQKLNTWFEAEHVDETEMTVYNEASNDELFRCSYCHCKVYNIDMTEGDCGWGFTFCPQCGGEVYESDSRKIEAKLGEPTNGTDGETNGINDEITLPEGDAVSILRRAADSDTPMVSLCDRFDAAPLLPSEHSRVFGQLADMVERDYVPQANYRNMCKHIGEAHRERNELKDRIVELEKQWDARDSDCIALEAKVNRLEDEITDWSELHAQVLSERNHVIAERDEWKTKCETREFAYKQADAERKRYSEQIDELVAERDEWKATAKACDTCDGNYIKVEELKRERDEWKAKAEHYRNHVDRLIDTIATLTRKQPMTFDPEAPYENAELVAKYIDELKAKAEGQSKVRAGSSSAKRAAAVERVRKAKDAGTSIGYAIVGREYYPWEAYETLIDLLTDNDANDGSTPENDVSAHDVDANDGNATCNISGENVTHDSREKLEAELHAMEEWRSDGLYIETDFDEVCEWLDRQAAITRLECAEEHRTRLSELHDLLDEAASERELLRAELTEYKHSHPDAQNQQISKYDAPKSEETVENATSKCGIRDFADSREKLEADIRDFFGSMPIHLAKAIEWLDRQAAIAKRECEHDREALNHYSERYGEMDAEIAELNAKVDEQSELIAARGKTIESLEKFMSERKYKLKKQLESKTEQCRKLKAERDEYRELYEAAMSTDYGQLSKEHEQFREEISEMLDAAQQIERIRAKHETQLN